MSPINCRKFCIIIFSLTVLSFSLCQSASAQNFNFDKIYEKVTASSCIVEMDIEYSFGIHSTAQKSRMLGTVVTDDGLVVFNGISVGGDQMIPVLTSVNVKTTPTNIKLTFFDDKKYEAEYIGVDPSTKIGFLKIINPDNTKFKPIKFISKKNYRIGSWVALYTLLPDYISPPLAADVGLISSVIESPEFFPLTMGFTTSQMMSVVFDEDLMPVGLLGTLTDDPVNEIDPLSILEGPDRFSIPLLGVISSERIEKLVESPPQKGTNERGWLGISMQALTEDIAAFWNLDLTGGVIINDVMSQSPALKAGLLIGDIIYEINGEQVLTNREENISIFQRTISELGPNASVELSVIRFKDNLADTLKILVDLEAAPIAPSDAPEYEIPFLEFSVRNMVFIDYLSRNLDADSFSGVVVSEIKPGGLADVEGLLIGDIIQRIGSEDIKDITDFEQVISETEKEKPSEIIFFVWRANKTLFVNVKTEWNDQN